MTKYTMRYMCADQIDVITIFAVITNVVIKRVHCITNDFASEKPNITRSIQVHSGTYKLARKFSDSIYRENRPRYNIRSC